MASFKEAVEKTLGHEGGYVDDPDDPGGPTNWGISTRFLIGIGATIDVKDMTRDQAVGLYKEHFWDANNYGEFNHQEIAEKVFDSSVNMGAKASHRILQRALRACEQSIIDDGIIGGLTIHALNKVNPLCLTIAMRSEMAGHYRVLIAKKPVRRKYRRGWLRRAYQDNL